MHFSYIVWADKRESFEKIICSLLESSIAHMQIHSVKLGSPRATGRQINILFPVTSDAITHILPHRKMASRGLLSRVGFSYYRYRLPELSQSEVSARFDPATGAKLERALREG